MSAGKVAMGIWIAILTPIAIGIALLGAMAAWWFSMLVLTS